MAKASRRSAVKTLTIVRSRDFVVDKLLMPCEDGNHSRCTGWAVLKKEASAVNANYFLKCTCSCHKKQTQAKKIKGKQSKSVKKKAKKKTRQKTGKKKNKARRR